ncbi:hypothetical protein BHE74_00052775, partial [Ensete ventricosum]
YDEGPQSATTLCYTLGDHILCHSHLILSVLCLYIGFFNAMKGHTQFQGQLRGLGICLPSCLSEVLLYLLGLKVAITPASSHNHWSSVSPSQCGFNGAPRDEATQPGAVVVDELQAKELQSTKASVGGGGGGMTIKSSGVPSPSGAKDSPIASSHGDVVATGPEDRSEKVTCGSSPIEDSGGLGLSSIDGSVWEVATLGDGVVGG